MTMRNKIKKEYLSSKIKLLKIGNTGKGGG